MKQKLSTSQIELNFNSIPILLSYLDDQKRLLPRRITELSIKNQRQLTKAVKRARILGLLPFAIQVEY